MKKAAILAALFFPLLGAQATQQQSDKIIYQGDPCDLETHFLFPSPVEMYFRQHPEKKYPFESTSTANYRGHIATYEISDGRLYLVDIQKAVLPGEKPTDPPGKLVKEIFPQALDSHGKVPVDWFTGNIRIFGKPEKRHYQSPGDAKGYDDTVFTTVNLLQIDKGSVKRETMFPFDEYWQKFETVAAYEALKPEEKSAISEHIAFLNQHSPDWQNFGSIEPTGPAKSEADYSVFLTRYITTPVKIPLTKFIAVKDVAFKPGETSWMADDDLAPTKDRNILFLEMGSTDVPKGPWSNFTGGALQFVLILDSLAPRTIDFTEADSQRFRLINNFARNDKNDNPTRISGHLEILSSSEKEIVVTGLITFTTAKVATHQEIRLEKTAIPVLDLTAYVRRYNPAGEGYFSADNILKRIAEKEKPAP
ncbi:hypothetical protein DB345_02295 [Spartobacteria bacterium LR76]|nr:hypothetical protein DB345_02295 [Spartobacteria bacterium LR76]